MFVENFCAKETPFSDSVTSSSVIIYLFILYIYTYICVYIYMYVCIYVCMYMNHLASLLIYSN